MSDDHREAIRKFCQAIDDGILVSGAEVKLVIGRWTGMYNPFKKFYGKTVVINNVNKPDPNGDFDAGHVRVDEQNANCAIMFDEIEWEHLTRVANPIEQHLRGLTDVG